MGRVWRDRFIWTVVVLMLLPLVAYQVRGIRLIPGALWAAHLADPTFLLLTVIVLFVSRPPREGHREERRFWRLVQATCVLWLVGALASVSLAVLARAPFSWISIDAVFLCSYITLVLAADTRPHLPTGWSRRATGYRFAIAASLLFVFATAIYFFALPLVRRGAGGSMSTQATFVALDVLLVIRFFDLAYRARQTRWWSVYLWLTASMAASLISNSINLLAIAGKVHVSYGTALDAIWWVPFATIIVAARLRYHQRQESAVDRAVMVAEPRTDATPLLLLYAFSLPIAQLALDASGLLPEGQRWARQVLVLWVLLAFLALAIAQQLLLERRNRELRSQLQVLVTNEQLLQSQKLEAIGRLAGGLAHDFNNLLTVILARADLLATNLPADGADWRGAEAIRRAGERGAAMTRQLLAFSRSQVLRTRALDPARTVEEALAVLNRLVGEQIRIAAEFDPQLPPIEAEPSQVFQVLMNLITNARDAMPEGGRISIRVYRETVRAGDPELIPAPQQGEFVALEVCDGGVGIDDQTLRHIFEPFFTNKIGGTGLGLAVVYGIVAQGGGHVRVRSSQTNGTAITAFFPISRGSARKEVDSTNVVHQGGTRRRVLLVEDQEPVRASLREMLRFLGYEVLTAGSGAEALETCRSSQPPPELVLSDIVMPGMLGTELVRSLRREHPGIVAVLMSGFADTAADDELEACRRSETPFLGKPFTLESLQTVMLQAERLQAERSSSSASESPPAASSG